VKPILLLDMDDTTADLKHAWSRRILERHGFYTDPEKWTDWNLKNVLPREEAEAMYEVLREPGFFRHLAPLPGAMAGIRTLHKHFHIIFLSKGDILFGPPVLRNTLVGKNETSLLGRVENDLIALPDNDPRIREYWLNLSGLKTPSFEPLNPPVIISIQAIKHPYAYKWDYLVEFEPATDDPDRQKRIQYFVRWKHAIFDGQSVPETGVTRVLYSRYTSDKRNPNFEEPRWKGYFAVYAFDPVTGQFVKSDSAWFDLTRQDKPVPLRDPYDPPRSVLQIVFETRNDF
jgi:Uncharacterized protein conserved in bacteria